MKKMKRLVLMACACAVFVIAGCGGNTPDAVALDFLKTLQAGKIDDSYLKANCTEVTAKMFGMFLAMGKDEMAKEMEGVTFSVAETKIDGDTATVTIQTKGGKKGKDAVEESKIHLTNIDGKWMIDIRKEGERKKTATQAAKK